MDIDYFLEKAAYVIDFFPEEGDYRVVMETDTHDMYFYWKDDVITSIEVYNALDDSTVFLEEERLNKVKEWMKNQLSQLSGEKLQ